MEGDPQLPYACAVCRPERLQTDSRKRSKALDRFFSCSCFDSCSFQLSQRQYNFSTVYLCVGPYYYYSGFVCLSLYSFFFKKIIINFFPLLKREFQLLLNRGLACK